MIELDIQSEDQTLKILLPHPIPVTEQVWEEGATPLVSISCITYNHENYIRDAIEGFLMQKTTFPIEILIHDDSSTDRTADIIREYEKKYPQLIKPIYQLENQYSKGIRPINKFNFNRAYGKYLAMCEGDDYWNDPLKLQKQFVFLEANENYGLVHTDFSALKRRKNPFKKYNKNDEYLNDFLTARISIGTLTVMLRKGLYDSLPKHYENQQFKMGDLPLWIEISRVSKMKYLKDKTSVYRIHGSGVSNSPIIEDYIAFKKSSLEIKLFYIKKYKLDTLKKDAIKSFFSDIVRAAFKKNNKDVVEVYFRKLCRLGKPNFKSLVFYLVSKLSGFGIIYRLLIVKSN